MEKKTKKATNKNTEGPMQTGVYFPETINGSYMIRGFSDGTSQAVPLTGPVHTRAKEVLEKEMVTVIDSLLKRHREESSSK